MHDNNCRYCHTAVHTRNYIVAHELLPVGQSSKSRMRFLHNLRKGLFCLTRVILTQGINFEPTGLTQINNQRSILELWAGRPFHKKIFHKVRIAESAQQPTNYICTELAPKPTLCFLQLGNTLG